jgi:hypothetical protein
MFRVANLPFMLSVVVLNVVAPLLAIRHEGPQKKAIKILTNCAIIFAGSAITNRREPRSCLGRVFNSKLGHSATLGSKCMVGMQPLLKLKTRPKARPVS